SFARGNRSFWSTLTARGRGDARSWVFLAPGEDSPNCEIAHAEPLGDGSRGEPFRCESLHLGAAEYRPGPAERLASPPRVLKPRPYPFADDLTFELRECSGYVEHRAAHRCTCVYCFVQRNERDSERPELIERSCEMRHGTSESIEAEEHHGIDRSPSCISHQL